jgi:DNA polymerase/3'-5' exonuclease PolX
MKMSLKDWLRNGWLVAHKPSRQEIQDLLAIAERDLRECSGSVSEQEARELYELAGSLKRAVELWLKKNHPELFEK